jgi:photosystem II stability/assembly factor-like uncharacterized protein
VSFRTSLPRAKGFRQNEGKNNFELRTSVATIFGVSALVAAALLFPAHIGAQEVKFDSDSISGLGARNIGSAVMSGRVSALSAVKEDSRLTVYIGAASGGVWKSVNGGTTFKPVFDKQTSQSIGAIAIDPQAPKTIWVGTGEAWTRNSVSIGDGIYKSTDGGENWTNVGLKNSERISKILIDPKDGNTVYVCVPGKLWSDSEDRGVYKTTDGGQSWKNVLKGANLSTGCSMMSMNPRDSKSILSACGISGARAGRSGQEEKIQPRPAAVVFSARRTAVQLGPTWTKKAHRGFHRNPGDASL